MLARFFIDRPVLAWVISIVIVLIGAVAAVFLPIAEYPEEKFDQVMAVNVRGVWLGCKYALPEMNDGGSIIITSSISGLVASPDLSAYITSKHAVVGIMRAVALEAAPRGIRVNAIAPGWISTELTRGLTGDEARSAAILARTPMKRWGEPADIGGSIVYLCSDAARFVTGIVLPIDGGYAAM